MNARPRKPDADRRNRRVEIRLSDSEHQVIERAAGSSGIGPYMREAALERAAPSQGPFQSLLASPGGNSAQERLARRVAELQRARKEDLRVSTVQRSMGQVRRRLEVSVPHTWADVQTKVKQGNKYAYGEVTVTIKKSKRTDSPHPIKFTVFPRDDGIFLTMVAGNTLIHDRFVGDPDGDIAEGLADAWPDIEAELAVVFAVHV